VSKADLQVSWMVWKSRRQRATDRRENVESVKLRNHKLRHHIVFITNGLQGKLRV